MNKVDQIEVLYRMWVMAMERPEWFRDARATRRELDRRSKEVAHE
ncbi:hypothetical protein [Paenibacillus sp. P22]|nr:hypothetical protein [Paenibacillus sp. P22]CDN41667.1 hypothetical protein BN871_AJ_00190 [Paenibacillus sp. P22]